jgi:hypothetical protein
MLSSNYYFFLSAGCMYEGRYYSVGATITDHGAFYTFIGVGRTHEYPEKTTDLPQLIDELYHIFPGRYPLYP